MFEFYAPYVKGAHSGALQDVRERNAMENDAVAYIRKTHVSTIETPNLTEILSDDEIRNCIYYYADNYYE